MNGGRFDFDDGGTYCGGWEEGKAHGHGVCTGPDGQGEYAGAWHYGFEVSGIYIWPSGSSYMGQWQNGKRHGLGVEQRGRWLYKGEWTQGYKGRYGRREAVNSGAHYLGTWSSGLHDGYGSEVYADGGSYKGQWLRGMRHGYGIRTSAPYEQAAKHRSRSSTTHASLTSLRSNYAASCDDDDHMPNHIGGGTSSRSKDRRTAAAEEQEQYLARGGFVLRAFSAGTNKRRRSLSERSLAMKRTILNNLRFRKQNSTGDIHQRIQSAGAVSLRSSGSTLSCTSDEDGSMHHRHQHHNQQGSPQVEQTETVDPSTVEVYKGEWKNDTRNGYGICERSDGLRYMGEWLENKKHGYGVTFFKDGTKEEGRYKNNTLISSTRKRGILFVRSSRLRERIEAVVEQAKRAADIAVQRVEIALSRTMTAQERADVAVEFAERAKDDADSARIYAAQFDPSFKQPGIDHLRQQRQRTATPSLMQNHVYSNHVSFEGSGGGTGSPHYQPYPQYPPMETNASTSAGYNPQNPNQRYNQWNHKKVTADGYQSDSRVTPQHSLQQHFNPSNQNSPQSENASGRLPHQHSADSNQSHDRLILSQDQSQVGSSMHIAGYQPMTDNPSSPMSPQNLPHPPQNQLIQSPSANAINPIALQQSATQFPIQQNIATTAHMGESGPLASTSKQMGNSVGPPGSGVSPVSVADPVLRQRLGVRSQGRRTAGDGSPSIVSLADDHFDQYTMRRATTTTGISSNNIRGNLMDAGLRRNRPSLIRQNEVGAAALGNDSTALEASTSPNLLNRRSTLATARDRRMTAGTAGDSPDGTGALLHSVYGADDSIHVDHVLLGASVGDRGSLPNLDELAQQEVHLQREEAARLASKQRLESQRLQQEEELLRQNPLRYIYHPEFRNWLIRWKIPLLLIFGNLLLFFCFMHLLSTKSSDGPESANVSED